MDLLIILDASGSLYDQGGNVSWPTLKNFTKALIQQGTNVGRLDRVALIQFSNVAHLRFNFSRYSSLNEILAAVDALQFIGLSTNTSQALDLGRRVFSESGYGSRANAKHIMLLITDLWVDPEPTWKSQYRASVSQLQQISDIRRFCEYNVYR